ncbi:unnamed protein product [Protopolystoma xenopodis]|uniref:Uncharacterized protein n=1 Tax=Protopolystoma xenopodis TaxID=117903 RepID=A0A3S5C8K8_9PLAT|nr:unnamed protein product [Protopolystoma xenopodis]
MLAMPSASSSCLIINANVGMQGGVRINCQIHLGSIAIAPASGITWLRLAEVGAHIRPQHRLIRCMALFATRFPAMGRHSGTKSLIGSHDYHTLAGPICVFCQRDEQSLLVGLFSIGVNALLRQ